jgi:protein-disulfide isomerase
MSNMLKLPFSINRDNYIGFQQASLELVQYGDFQCEHCGSVYTSIKLIQQYLGDKLKFVFRHFPLVTLHRFALDAAVASEAAGLQGKFWQMHDLIFENQKYLTKSSFSGFADKLQLDMTVFENSREYKKIIHKIVNDFESGVKSGVDCTPTFFINGHRYNGFENFESLYRTCKYAMAINYMAV